MRTATLFKFAGVGHCGGKHHSAIEDALSDSARPAGISAFQQLKTTYVNVVSNRRRHAFGHMQKPNALHVLVTADCERGLQRADPQHWCSSGVWRVQGKKALAGNGTSWLLVEPPAPCPLPSPPGGERAQGGVGAFSQIERCPPGSVQSRTPEGTVVYLSWFEALPTISPTMGPLSRPGKSTSQSAGTLAL